MAWYAYCIMEQKDLSGSTRARRPFPLNNIFGIGETQVFAYPVGEFAVVVSEYAGQLVQQAVVQHSKVVSECFRSSTVLPFKFGTVFDTDEALRRSVKANRRGFTESVCRLRGKAEMHLKVVVKDGSLREAMMDVDLPHTTGGEYLKVLREKAAKHRERQTKARALSVQVHKLFNPLQEEVCCRKDASGSMQLDIAHLIDHKSVEKYQSRYSSAARLLQGCELLITGPWPPYHFTPNKTA